MDSDDDRPLKRLRKKADPAPIEVIEDRLDWSEDDDDRRKPLRRLKKSADKPALTAAEAGKVAGKMGDKDIDVWSLLQHQGPPPAKRRHTEQQGLPPAKRKHTEQQGHPPPQPAAKPGSAAAAPQSGSQHVSPAQTPLPPQLTPPLPLPRHPHDGRTQVESDKDRNVAEKYMKLQKNSMYGPLRLNNMSVDELTAVKGFRSAILDHYTPPDGRPVVFTQIGKKIMQKKYRNASKKYRNKKNKLPEAMIDNLQIYGIPPLFVLTYIYNKCSDNNKGAQNINDVSNCVEFILDRTLEEITNFSTLGLRDLLSHLFSKEEVTSIWQNNIPSNMD